MKDLKEVEWHDLPIESISINIDSIEIVITPFNENSQKYDSLTLKLFSFDNIELSIAAELATSDLNNLEISSFEYTINNGLLTGNLGILPANKGFWSISFTHANWCINDNTNLT